MHSRMMPLGMLVAIVLSLLVPHRARAFTLRSARVNFTSGELVVCSVTNHGTKAILVTVHLRGSVLRLDQGEVTSVNESDCAVGPLGPGQSCNVLHDKIKLPAGGIFCVVEGANASTRAVLQVIAPLGSTSATLPLTK